MPQMQRSGRVRADKFQVDALARERMTMTVLLALAQDGSNDLALSRSRERNVQKSGAGDIHSGDPILDIRIC